MDVQQAREWGIDRIRSVTAWAVVAAMAGTGVVAGLVKVEVPGHSGAAASTGSSGGTSGGATTPSGGSSSTTPGSSIDSGGSSFAPSPAPSTGSGRAVSRSGAS